MKKSLLLFWAILLSLGCQAQVVKQLKHLPKTVQQNAPKYNKVQQKAAEGKGFTIQFCDELGSWYVLTTQNKVTYRCYLYIPPERATMIADNEITSISFSTASGYDIKPRSGSVFVSEDLDGMPITSTACSMVDCYKQYQAGRAPYQTVELETPYVIKKNTGFYFGYVVESCRYSQAESIADYPVGVDALAPNGYPSFVELTDATTGEQIGVVDLSVDMGNNNTNLFLAATTVGEATGFENVLRLGNIEMGDFTLPVFRADNTTPLMVSMENTGGNDITSIEYSLDVNGTKGENKTLNLDVKAGKKYYIELPAPKYNVGSNELTFNVTKINGVETTMSSYGICIALDNEGYDRKFVVEEGTGTWCGYCPRGIVGLQKMTEKYPDSFIGIAIHDGNDPFVVSDYQPVVNEFFYAGLPHCVANRDPMYVFDPNIDYLNLCKDYWAEQRAPAKVDLKVEKATDGLKVAANTTFAYSEDNGSYKLAFVILEDGLQSQQRNYYSGYPNELEWWGDQPEYVDWTYEHTARDIVDCAGIVGSIPTKIVAKTPMTYERLLPLDSEIVVDNTSIVALILESRTGVILNATKVMAKDYIDPNAISAPSTTNAQPADYFNLQGMRVGKDTKGSIIVRRQGGKISKFVAR